MVHYLYIINYGMDLILILLHYAFCPYPVQLTE